MKGKNLLDQMEFIDPEYISEADTVSKKKAKITWAIAAAAILAAASVYLLLPMLFTDNRIPLTKDSTDTEITENTEKVTSKYTETVSYSSLLFPEDSQNFEFSESAIQSESMMDMDIASFYESFTEGCAFVEGRVTDMYEKRYDHTIGSTKIPSITVAHCYTVTVIYEFEITKVWNEEFNTGEKILIEDVQYSFDSQFHMKKGHAYVVPIEDVGDKIAVMSIVGEVIDGETERQTPYTTCYPYHPQIEITKDGYYFFPDEWETLASENTVRVTDVDFGEGSVFYKDKMVLLDPESFDIKMNELISKYQ